MWAPLPRIEEYRILQNICEEDRKRERERERESVRSESVNGEPSSSEAMESGIREVITIVVQDMQDSHRQRGPPPRQNGPSHPIRRLHARKYHFSSSQTLPHFLSVFCFLIKYLGFSL